MLLINLESNKNYETNVFFFLMKEFLLCICISCLYAYQSKPIAHNKKTLNQLRIHELFLLILVS